MSRSPSYLPVLRNEDHIIPFEHEFPKFPIFYAFEGLSFQEEEDEKR